MISIKNQIPNIYYDASRDFQVLGHLYEVVLNYSKTNADLLYLLPNGIDTDTRATELLATTLGFKLRRNYDKAQLAALVSIFPRLLKMKGTITAINLAGNALVKASGVPGTFASDLDPKTHVLTIQIPIELSDITLFIDLLPYILPSGIRVSIVRRTVITERILTPVGAMAVMRKSLPSSTIAEPLHPLGLARVSADATALDYSNSNFINPDNHKAIAGVFAASPIIAFDPDAESNTKANNEEETI